MREEREKSTKGERKIRRRQPQTDNKRRTATIPDFGGQKSVSTTQHEWKITHLKL